MLGSVAMELHTVRLAKAFATVAVCCACLPLIGCGQPSESSPGASDAAAESSVRRAPAAHPLPPGSGLDARPHNASCVAPPQPKGGLALVVTRMFPNLYFQEPVQLLQAPAEESQWYVVEQGGLIKAFTSTDSQNATARPFADLTSRIGGAGSGSLIAMAFDPAFASSNRVYVSYVAPGPETRISSFTVSAGVVDPASEAIVIRVPRPSSGGGGAIAFGADGMLYAAFGAGGSDSLAGKLIRIDVGGKNAYTVYASGLHDPRGLAFDGTSQSRQLWLADSGRGGSEEVFRVVEAGNLNDPVAAYPHTVGDSIVAGHVYRGTAIAWLANRYVFADRTAGSLFALLPDGKGGQYARQLLNKGGASVASLAQAKNGELYFVSSSGGLYGVQSGVIRQRLSQTGCVDPANPAQPAAGLIPYEVAVPLWSDGAHKRRWMAVPDDEKIKVESDGDWTFPTGTVLVKEFIVNDELIETRLFMRHSDTGNWRGYSYRWNATHTDADLVVEQEHVDLGKQAWSYMTSNQCSECHTKAAGGSLGLETRQLNTTMLYPETGRSANQLGTLMKIGMFSNELQVEDRYPDPNDETVAFPERVRSYLHVNCQQCHRPQANSIVRHDLRYSTPLAATHTCNATLEGLSLGAKDERIIVPGHPERSTLYLRMTSRGIVDISMPPVGTSQVDAHGLAMVKKWVEGMRSDCQWPAQ